jgi:hypothetical protein
MSSLLNEPEILVGLMVISGILVMLGFRKAGLGLAGLTLGAILFGPAVIRLLDGLPMAARLAVCVVGLLLAFRLIFGRAVTAYVLGRLLYDLIRAPVRMLARLIRWP